MSRTHRLSLASTISVSNLPRKPSLVHVHVDRTVEISSSTFTPVLRHTSSTFEMVKLLDLEQGLMDTRSPDLIALPVRFDSQGGDNLGKTADKICLDL